MENGTMRWVFALLLVGFINCVRAGDVQNLIARPAYQDQQAAVANAILADMTTTDDDRSLPREIKNIGDLKLEVFKAETKDSVESHNALDKTTTAIKAPDGYKLIVVHLTGKISAACTYTFDTREFAVVYQAESKLAGEKEIGTRISLSRALAFDGDWSIPSTGSSVAISTCAYKPQKVSLRVAFILPQEVTNFAVRCPTTTKNLVDLSYADGCGPSSASPAREDAPKTMPTSMATSDAQPPAAIGKPAVEPLISSLKDQDCNVRESAVMELIALGQPAVETLIPYLKHKDENVRSGIAQALGKLGDKRAVKPLIGCLKDKDQYVRSDAAEALGELGDRMAVEPLTTCLKDDDAIVRCQAFVALESLGVARTADELAEELPEWGINYRLGAALEKLGWKPATDVEQVYFWVCKRDGKHLRMNWEKTKQVLLADVQSGNKRKIDNAVYSFVSIGNEDIIPTLIDILNNDHGTKEMAEAYLNCGHGQLDKAARAWAAAHGYEIISGSHHVKVIWHDPWWTV